MADMQKLANALQGFGAGVQGNLPQFLQLQELREIQRQQQDQQRRSQLSAERKKAFALDTRQTRDFLELGQTDQALTLINNRLRNGLLLPEFDPSTTNFIKGLIEEEKTGEAIQFLNVLDSAAVDEGVLPAREAREPLSPEGKLQSDIDQGIVTQEQAETMQESGGMASAVTRVFDNGTVLRQLPNGVVEVEAPDGTLVSGEDRVEALKKAREEEVSFAQSRAEATARGSSSEERLQLTIDEGLDAAQSASVLRRGLELMEGIRTGGVANLAFKIKQTFGVESGDEGELASNLGKAVLSQLRATFGAQFTEREGARLEGIEARMGASPATNVRLLNQTLAIVERAANRGIDAAIESRDFRTADDIRNLLEFRLSDEAVPDPTSEEIDITDPSLSIDDLIRMREELENADN